MHLRTIVLSLSFAIACTATEPRIPLVPFDESVVLVESIADPAWPSDHIALDSTSISGDNLRLFTQHGGGCQNHEVALIVERAFIETAPPMLRARLSHDAHNDLCEALIFRTLNIDLSPVQRHYADSYASATGSVVLDIEGQRVTYSFQPIRHFAR